MQLKLFAYSWWPKVDSENLMTWKTNDEFVSDTDFPSNRGD